MKVNQKILLTDFFCFYDPYFVLELIYDENGNQTTETNGILLK